MASIFFATDFFSRFFANESVRVVRLAFQAACVAVVLQRIHCAFVMASRLSWPTSKHSPCHIP